METNHTIGRRVLSMALALCMAIGLVTALPGTARAATTESAANMDIGTWAGDGLHRYIEFGEYNGEPILWRVLEVYTSTGSEDDNGGKKTALLMADEILDTRQWHHTYEPVTWPTSDLYDWLNSGGSYIGGSDGFLDTAFDANEANAIVTSTYDASVTSKVFLLSRTDGLTNTDYFAGDTDRAASADWWTRTGDMYAYYVGSNGDNTYSATSVNDRRSVRPAMRVDLTASQFDGIAVGYGVTVEVEEGSGNPVRGARVEVENSTGETVTAYTNTNGAIQLENVAGGSIEVTVEAAGYKQYSAQETVTSTEREFTVELEGSTQSLHQTVYYGQYSNTALAWQVLDINQKEGTAVLLAESSVGSRVFNTNMNGNWKDSDIRAWLNSEGSYEAGGGFYKEAFTAEEQAGIEETEYTLGGTYSYTGYGWDTEDISRMYLLSVEEAEKYLPDTTMRSFSAYWWLRSPGNITYSAAAVVSNGVVSSGGYDVSNSLLAVRPAFTVNLESVIFTSKASEASKFDTAAGGNLVGVSAPTEAVKLTVVDGEMDFSTDDSPRTVRADDTVRIDYTDATTGANTFISCIIEDEDGELLYYGKLADQDGGSAVGTAEFTVPASMADGDYTLKMFTEQCNSAYYTDYASEPVEIALKVDNSATGAELVVTAPNISSAAYGYSQPTPQAITIENIGDVDAVITDVKVNTLDFVIDGGGSTVYAGDTIETWTIQPVSGLGVGTHTGIIIVYYNGGTEVTVSVRFEVYTIPGAPTITDVTPGDGAVTVVFDPPADDGGDTITSYTVVSDPDGITATGTASPITVTGLNNGTSYTFTIYATNGAGDGLASSASSAVTPLSPVTSITVTGAGGVDRITTKGGTLQMEADVQPAQAVQAVDWSVTGDAATIDSDGLLTAAKNGTVTVRATATDGTGKYGEMAVTITGQSSSTPGGGTTPATYTVTFDSRGGTAVASLRIQSGKSATEPEAPTREGYTFTGWYTDADCTEEYDFATPVTKNLTLYAGWEADGTETPEPDPEVIEPYIEGYPDGTFRPNNGITRAETADMLYTLAGGESGATADFTDVSTANWYHDAVAWLSDSGIVDGYPDGSFRPDETITRAEFTVMIVRYMNLTATGTPSFPDVSGWSAPYIAAAETAGLASGYPDSTFGVDDDMTRAQAVTMLNRMLDRDTDPELFEGLENPFDDVPATHWAYYDIMAAAVEH